MRWGGGRWPFQPGRSARRLVNAALRRRYHAASAGLPGGVSGSPGPVAMPDPDEVTYLVLAERSVPYLLARVRWPDVAQAISANSPDWLNDTGLFDLPYDPSAVTVSFPQAASVAAGWGRQLGPGVAGGVPAFIRRMPANWSHLSPAERHAWGIESVGRRSVSARRARRLRSRQAKIAASSAAAQANGHADTLARAGAGPWAAVDGPAADGRGPVAGRTNGLRSAATERRRHARVPVDGRAHIRSGQTTISAGLIDLSEGGVRCVLPEAPPLPAPGAPLDGPFLLEAEATNRRICLDVAGRMSWHRSIAASTHFGIVFGELDDGGTEAVQRFSTAAASRRGHR
jgi:hypothetical protein